MLGVKASLSHLLTDLQLLGTHQPATPWLPDAGAGRGWTTKHTPFLVPMYLQ